MSRAAAALALGLAFALSAPAAAQRPRCGFGEALAALRAAGAGLARPVEGLGSGRAQAAAVHDALRTAREGLAGCGCRRAAEDAGEAAMLAEQGAAEHSAARIAAVLDRAAFSARLARERLDREGCS